MKKQISALALCLCMALALLPGARAADTYTDSGSPDIPKMSAEQIAQLLEGNPLDMPQNVFDELPSASAPYALGKVSDAALQAAANRLNALRTLAGLPSVALDPELSTLAQYGAVIDAANKTISHFPARPEGMDDDFYQKARTANSQSNLYAGVSLTYAMDGFMDDSDSSNVDRLGHRRWQLNPTLDRIGLGYVENQRQSGVFDYLKYTTEHVFSRGGGCDYDFIAWPASGNFPNDMAFFNINTAWSVTLNPGKYQTPQRSEITVTMTRESDGRSWSFSDSGSGGYFNVDTGGYGVANCIIFRPDAADTYNGVYTVTVDGLKTKSGSPTSLSYQVDFFSTKSFSTEKYFSITLDYNNENHDRGSLTTNASGSLDRLPTLTAPDGQYIEGWYTEPTGGVKITSSYVFNSDSVIYAHWARTPGTFTVTLDPNGGTLTGPDTVETDGSGLLEQELPIPTREGYSFKGWYTYKNGGSKVDNTFIFSTDRTVYAQWKQEEQKTFAITLDPNGGTLFGADSATTNQLGRLTALPSDPIRKGYTFQGWFTQPSGGSRISLATVFNADSTIYAQWKKKEADGFAITLDPNGGYLSGPSSLSTGTGGCLTAMPSDPVRQGYAFEGWYTQPSGGSRVFLNTVFSVDSTIYAQWKEKETDGFAITLDPNGGYLTGADSISAGRDGHLTSMPYDPTRPGHTFEGWFTQPSGGSRVGLDTVFDGDSTIYAQWKASQQTEPVFTDVSPDAYYYDAVQWALENSITTGTSGTTFSPSDTCTREQTITFIWRANGSPEPLNSYCPFNDVRAGDYYYKAVLWGVENGITNGMSGDRFGVGVPCNRAMIVTFLWNANGNPDVSPVNSFDDVSPDGWYYNAVAWALDQGITKGTGDTTFSPGNYCDRGQMVTFLYRNATFS